MSTDFKFAVHVGIDRNRIAAFEKNYEIAGATFIEGDGWNCWGEEPGTDVNDSDTLLVTQGFLNLGNAINYAEELVDNCLLLVGMNPAAYGSQRTSDDGIVAVVSNWENFSVQYLHIWEDGREVTHSNAVR